MTPVLFKEMLDQVYASNKSTTNDDKKDKGDSKKDSVVKASSKIAGSPKSSITPASTTSQTTAGAGSTINAENATSSTVAENQCAKCTQSYRKVDLSDASPTSELHQVRRAYSDTHSSQRDCLWAY